MSDYTPGPWQIQKYVNYEGWSIWGSEDGCIAERWYASRRDNSEDARMHANAALIAAAPDLLAAAEGVLPWLAGINTKGDPNVVDALTDVYGQLAAAIKKAKGQQ